jgi:fatty acid desaturase
LWSFLANAFHELVHGTVFRSKKPGQIFLNLYSFLGQNNPVHFWASHTDHHKYTLYPPRDLEVVLPMELTLRGFLQCLVLNPWGIVRNFRQHGRQSRGILSGEWEQRLFPPGEPRKKQRLVNWARVIFYGHAFILVFSTIMAIVTQSPHWVVVPFVTTFAPNIGSWVHFLLNNAQHAGMTDQVPDYRLCSRTIRLNRVLEYFYWHMNYHIEHHMFAAVPCYKLRKLHRAIEHDLPHTPVGILETWKDISAILRRQKIDRNYQFTPLVANPSFGEKTCVMAASPRA